jgi:predicted negative regulator of RcsB-dependent stress response
MNDKNLGLIAVIILGVGGYFVYKEYQKKKKENAPAQISDVDTIITNGKNKDRSFVTSLGAGFVKAWADGVRGSMASFTYNGKTYNTQGGKLIK